MTNYYKILSKSLLIISLLVANSCDIEQPLTNQSNQGSFWKNDQDALDALTSCYPGLLPNWDRFFGNEALSDNAVVNGTSYEQVAQIANGSYSNLNPRLTSEWADQYANIRRCNVVLENVDQIKGSTATLINRYKAEARFIRAWNYLTLTSFFGDVPLVKKTLTVSESQNLTRNPSAEVIQFVLDELQAIQADLPVSYPATEIGRITRGAAIALRARANLYSAKWQDVVADCEKLILSTSNGSFGLNNSFPGLFSVTAENSNEIILALQMGGPRVQGNQRNFLPPSVGKLRGSLSPTRALVDDYIMLNGRAITESGSGYSALKPYANRDPRFEFTIVRDSATMVDFDGVIQTIYTHQGANPNQNSIDDRGASNTGFYFRKYYDQTATAFNSSLNLILIRYADVLLMYAEAKNELNQFTAAVWNQTIQPIRQRAGFSQSAALNFDNTLNQAGYRNVIRRERRSELAFESLRIFDIRRWKTAEVVLNQNVTGIRAQAPYTTDANGNIVVEVRKFVAPQHYLWPVPQFELLQNPKLGNNPGWQ